MTRNAHDNFDHFPFALADDDDSAPLGLFWADPEAPEIDSDFDGPRAFTAADLDALAYGPAFAGLI